MWRIIKYKIRTLFENRFFIFIILAYFVILNYFVLQNSGILSIGSGEYNSDIKYMLMINNFILISLLLGLLLSSYIGNGLIGKDIESGQLYVLLYSFQKREKYILGNWLGLVIVLLSVLLFTLFNYLVIALCLDIKIVINDLLTCFKDIFLNMLVVLTVTSVSSIYIKGKSSIMFGLFALLIFTIYTTGRIPIIDLTISMGNAARNILAMLFPIRMTYVPSINDVEIVSKAIVDPLGIHMSTYQVLYLISILFLGKKLFDIKEL